MEPMQQESKELKRKKLHKGGKVRILFGSVLAAVLLVVLFVLSFEYLAYVKDTIRRDSKSNLEEMGKHIAQSLYSDIQSTNNILEDIVLHLRWTAFANQEEETSFLREQKEYWGFYDLSLSGENGVWHHADGSKDASLDRELLSRALQEGETVYDFRVVNGEDCVIFITPFPKEEAYSRPYLAVSATYAIRNWDRLMNVDIYDGQAISYILTQSGVMVTRDVRRGESYNFLESMKDARFEEGVTLEQIQQSLKEGEAFQVSYQKDGTEFYLSSSPIGFNNWSLVFTVPSSTVNRAGDSMVQSVIVICVTLALLFMVIFWVFQIYQYRSKKALWNMAYRDEVTGGANKNRFEVDARALLSENSRIYLLVYMNIRQFKLLNNRLGKEEADRILSMLHAGIHHLLTPKECGGRLSADNFVLLLEETKPGSVEQRMKSFAEAYSIITASNGISHSLQLVFGLYSIQQRNEDLTQMIDRANLAMKAASANGAKLYAVYDHLMLEQKAREKDLEESLLKKETMEEFFICVQPKVNLHTGRVTGGEALARWNSPKYGMVSPGEFIPLAEKIGMVYQIDWMAFQRVCQLLAQWQEQGKELITISFNLSKAQLEIPNFLDHYRDVLQQYSIPNQYLEFEFTESLLYESSDSLQKAVDDIHAMGCRCSVDDFGFGYSSLGLLGQFEADVLKLDRSFFIRDMEPQSRNNQIVKNVIQLAESLAMQTVAEGVEHQEQVEMLKAFGCTSIQGYIFSKPLDVQDFESFVQEKNRGGSK